MFTVLSTKTFDKKMKKLGLQDTIEKFSKSLSHNPFSGKPLGIPFLREKRLKNKRIYYLIYKNKRIVFLIAVSSKKDQQETINYIKDNLETFRRSLKLFFVLFPLQCL